MIRIKPGDAVRIVDRETTPNDAKSGLYYSHFRGLAGKIQKVYADGEVAVSIDLETLPEDVWKRHMNVRDRMREAWLRGLADEQRRKLTPEQKELALAYVVLVSGADLERPRPSRARRA